MCLYVYDKLQEIPPFLINVRSRVGDEGSETVSFVFSTIHAIPQLGVQQPTRAPRLAPRADPTVHVRSLYPAARRLPHPAPQTKPSSVFPGLWLWEWPSGGIPGQVLRPDGGKKWGHLFPLLTLGLSLVLQTGDTATSNEQKP